MNRETKRLLKKAYKAAVEASKEHEENYVSPHFFLAYLEFSGLKELPPEEVFKVMKMLFNWQSFGRETKFFV